MNLRPFQIVLLGIFTFFAFLSLILLGGYEREQTAEELAYGDRVVIWGVLDRGTFEDVFRNVTQEDKPFGVVEYYEFDESSFDSEFVNAIAEGRSPDMIVLPAESLVKHRAKLLAIPYETYPINQYRNTFVDGAEVYTMLDGIYALPFAVDTLLLYWNRDTFASNGLAQAPRTWEEVVANVVPRITQRDNSRNVLQSTIAFGEFRNVMHAKDILMMLAIQSGSQLVADTERGYKVQLNDSGTANNRAPMESALQFFTDFSNANSPTYSWNRAMPQDKNAFLSGDLALYFGYGSEAEDIDSKNPNLNFDVAQVPQGASATALRTYGKFYGFAIPRASANPNGAFAAATKLTSAKVNDSLTRAFNMASPRRDVVAAGDGSPYRSVMLQSSLIARSWLDPEPEESKGIFMQMVEDVVSNRSRVGEAVSDAINRLVLEY